MRHDHVTLRPNPSAPAMSWASRDASSVRMLRTEAEDVGVGDDETLMIYGFPWFPQGKFYMAGTLTWKDKPSTPAFLPCRISSQYVVLLWAPCQCSGSGSATSLQGFLLLFVLFGFGEMFVPGYFFGFVHNCLSC